MITFLLFSVIVVIVTILYTLWGFIFGFMETPPKMFGLRKLENFRWQHFRKDSVKWFLRSGVPLAILNWIIAYQLAGSVSFKEIFATDISLFGKLLVAFSTYLDFFIGLGVSYVVIFLIEFIISILVLRRKAMTYPEIEIVAGDGGSFNDENATTDEHEPTGPIEGQKRITD